MVDLLVFFPAVRLALTMVVMKAGLTVDGEVELKAPWRAVLKANKLEFAMVAN